MFTDQTVWVYGLNDRYSVVCSRRINGVCMSDPRLHHEAVWLKMNNPRIDKIYAATNDDDVCDAYLASRRSRTIEDRIVFKILLEEVGVCLA